MALRLPPLSGLRLFEAAARCGSFKRAAQELNLTPGALSHGIDSLEQWLDVELFERKARGVILTPAPGYLRDVSPRGALDWSRATLIHIPSSAEDWETWCNHSRIDVSAARKIIVSSVQLALEAAVDGLGIAIGRLPLINDDLEAGRLAVAIDHVVPVLTGYWLVQPPGLETRREIVSFRNWLLKETSQFSWHGHGAKAGIARLA